MSQHVRHPVARRQPRERPSPANAPGAGPPRPLTATAGKRQPPQAPMPPAGPAGDRRDGSAPPRDQMPADLQPPPRGARLGGPRQGPGARYRRTCNRHPREPAWAGSVRTPGLDTGGPATATPPKAEDGPRTISHPCDTGACDNPPEPSGSHGNPALPGPGPPHRRPSLRPPGAREPCFARRGEVLDWQLRPQERESLASYQAISPGSMPAAPGRSGALPVPRDASSVARLQPLGAPALFLNQLFPPPVARAFSGHSTCVFGTSGRPQPPGPMGRGSSKPWRSRHQSPAPGPPWGEGSRARRASGCNAQPPCTWGAGDGWPWARPPA